DAGRNALNKAGDVASFGGELTHLAVGTGKFDASVEAKNLTSLKNELARFSLNGGGVDTETGTLRFVMSIEPTLTMEVFELGIYLSDGTLLAVASTTEVQSIMSLHANVVAIVTFGFVLTDVNLKNVTIKIDPNTPIAVMLMNQ
ncbi:phage tail protein, partial [Acinetobacter baumannii]|nr:phage tail protein [Acinetobacter baumannii]